MTNTLILTRPTLKNQTIAILCAVAAAVLLPQAFHLIGIASGLGAAPGAAFLPMHLPVLLVGLLAGPAAGVVAGALSPLVSSALSGMPAAVMLPNMIAELAGYGLAAGLLADKKMPVLGKVLLSQMAGRICKAAVLLASVYLVGFNALPVSLIWTSIAAGLPGLVLQWALIPLILFWTGKRTAGND